MTPAIYTSHWRSELLADVDATIVAISRGKPRHRLPFRYRVASELAPDDHTWAQEDRESFERAYLDQLEELGAEAILGRLGELAGGKPCVLLCWEKLVDPSEWCHRQTLATFLRHGANIEVPELRAEDLPQRPDAAETRLF